MTRRSAGALSVVAIVATTALSGLTAQNSGLLAGTVVRAGSSEPVTGAIVVLSARGTEVGRVMVDSRGRFLFPALSDGVYTVTASRPGFAGGAAYQREPLAPGRPIEIRQAQRIVDLSLPLWKLGTIDGVTLDERGDPMGGVEVRALRRTLLGGERRLAPGGPGASSESDDRGHYRLTGLFPGDYVVAARPARDPETPLLLATLATNPAAAADIMAGLGGTGGMPTVDATVSQYPLTLHPAAATLTGATVITLGAGQERSHVDFHLKPARGVRIAGVVTGPPHAIGGVNVRLVLADDPDDTSALYVASTVSEPDGRFEFAGVAPGRYRLCAERSPAATPPQPGPGPAPPPNPQPAGGRPGDAIPMMPPLSSEPTWWATLPVVAGTRDIAGVSLAIKPGPVVRGQVQFQGSTPRPAAMALTALFVRLEFADRVPAPGSAALRGEVDGEARFRTMSVLPGRYFLRVANVPRGWTVLSATAGGRDLLDVPIDLRGPDVNDVVITLTDRALASIRGRVLTRAGREAADAMVLAFPADRTLWLDASGSARRLRGVRPQSDGTYEMVNLPAGNYFVMATAAGASAEWRDPARLQIMSRTATRIRLDDGQNQSLDLQVPLDLKVR
jgi:hypothetical protein